MPVPGRTNGDDTPRSRRALSLDGEEQGTDSDRSGISYKDCFSASPGVRYGSSQDEYCWESPQQQHHGYTENHLARSKAVFVFAPGNDILEVDKAIELKQI